MLCPLEDPPAVPPTCPSSVSPYVLSYCCHYGWLIVSTGNSTALPGILRPCRARASLAPWSHHHSLDGEGDASSGAFGATGLPSFDLWECRAHPWAVLMACPVPSPHWIADVYTDTVCPLQGSSVAVLGFAGPWLPALPDSATWACM